MPTISFTVDGPAGKGGTARFEPRAMFEADGKLVTSWASPRLVKYTNNTAVSVVLPEGPWKVGGLSGGQPLPIDVGSVNADLKDLIVFNLPPSAPATTLSQAVAAWMDSNVNTEVTDTLMSELLADEGSDAVAAVDARVAAGTAGLLSEAVAENTYAPKTIEATVAGKYSKPGAGIPISDLKKSDLDANYATTAQGVKAEVALTGQIMDGFLRITIPTLPDVVAETVTETV